MLQQQNRSFIKLSNVPLKRFSLQPRISPQGRSHGAQKVYNKDTRSLYVHSDDKKHVNHPENLKSFQSHVVWVHFFFQSYIIMKSLFVVFSKLVEMVIQIASVKPYDFSFGAINDKLYIFFLLENQTFKNESLVMNCPFF